MKHLIYLTFGLVLALGIACGGGESDSSEEPADSSDASELTAADVQRGKELFAQNGCVTCHGETGKGDGPAGAGLNPPPRNFADTENYKQGSDVDSIAATIATGVPGSSMVAYSHIPEGDRKEIAKFIVYLQSQ